MSEQRQRTYSDSSCFSGSDLEELEVNLYSQLHHEPNDGTLVLQLPSNVPALEQVQNQAQDSVSIRNKPQHKEASEPETSQQQEDATVINATDTQTEHNNSCVAAPLCERSEDVVQIHTTENQNEECLEETKYSYTLKSTPTNQDRVCSSDDDDSIIELTPPKKAPPPPVITVPTSDEDDVKKGSSEKKQVRKKKRKGDSDTSKSKKKGKKKVSLPVKQSGYVVVEQQNHEKVSKKRSSDVLHTIDSDDSCMGNIDTLKTDLHVNFSESKKVRCNDNPAETEIIVLSKKTGQNKTLSAMEFAPQTSNQQSRDGHKSLSAMELAPQTSSQQSRDGHKSLSAMELAPQTSSQQSRDIHKTLSAMEFVPLTSSQQSRDLVLPQAPFPSSWTPAMIEYYNMESGQHLFDLQSVLRTMRGEKWTVDYSDVLGPFGQSNDNRYFHGRRIRCSNCQQWGHIARQCPDPWKPLRCYMCGQEGHLEPRCPNKICLQCGRPNGLYSTVCVNCNGYWNLRCRICSMVGHDDSHCPDLWRRDYYKTSEESIPASGPLHKERKDQFCCNCTQRGHLYHECVGLRYSTFLPNLPYVVHPDVPLPDRPEVLPFGTQSNVGKQKLKKKRRVTKEKKLCLSKEMHKIFQDFGPKFTEFVENEYQVRLYLPPTLPQSSPSPRVVVAKGPKRNRKAAIRFILSEIDRAESAAIRSSDRNRRQLSALTDNRQTAHDTEPDVVLCSEREVVGSSARDLVVTVNNYAASTDTTVGRSDVENDMVYGRTCAGELGVPGMSDIGHSQNEERNRESGERNESSERNVGSGLKLSKNRDKLLRMLHDDIRRVETSKTNIDQVYRDFCQQREQLLTEGVSPTDCRSKLERYCKLLHTNLVGREQLGQGSYHMRLLRREIADLEASSDATVPDEVRERIEKHHAYIFRNFDDDNNDHLMSEYWKSSGKSNLNGRSPVSRNRKKFHKERFADGAGSFEAGHSGDFVRGERNKIDYDYEHLCNMPRRRLVGKVYKTLAFYRFDPSRRKSKTTLKLLHSELLKLKCADNNDHSAVQKVAALMVALK